MLARKLDGSTRFCVDFCRLNDVTRKDAQLLSRIDDTLDALGCACYLSTLDLAYGYWQVEVKPWDKEKTVFATPHGLFQFRVMPFGLAMFQRFMEHVVTGLHWSTCLVYLDNTIVFSATVEEHLKWLKEVCLRLKGAELKMKPSKCHLFQSSVKYLGHVLCKEGIKTDPDKIQCIADWPVPNDVRKLKCFLGLASYYRRFIKNFAQIAAPLHALSNSEASWEWSNRCNDAFFELKKQLMTSPVLVFPDFKLDFVLDTDASGEGIGAVLSQVVDGKERVVAYTSRVLSRTERSIVQREMLAVVWAAHHFRPYLYG